MAAHSKQSEITLTQLVSTSLAALLIGGCARGPAPAPAPDPTATKAVLVTGASSGIGRRITERLAAGGYFVYAGARSDDDLRALRAIKNVQPVRLDVTKPREIDAAVAAVNQGGRGLYGLVNNAGIMTNATVLDTKMSEFDAVMSVNVYGPWRITRAFAPLIIASKGRMINISSINGIDAPARLGAYSMSKHAVEALTDSLEEEMAPLGVHVSVVEPGTFKTNIATNEVERAGTGKRVASFISHAKDPGEVAAVVEKALFDSNPKRRYLIAPDAQQASVAIQSEIEHLVEINSNQPYAYDRETLIKMLDGALEQARVEEPVSVAGSGQ
jgi:NAD(P)-dependent dehydrogenase (short-subunit alcohol dehydrogenase family)